MKQSLLSFPIVAVFVVCFATSCTKVDKDHAINATWDYVHFKMPDGTIETYGDTNVVLEFANSNAVSGIGPQNTFEGVAEIWIDGEIQIGDLCCAGVTPGDSTYWTQLQFFQRLNGSSQYEIFSNSLVLKNTNDGSELQFLKR